MSIKNKSYNIKNHRYTGEPYYKKQQIVNNRSINNITKRGIINNNGDILNAKKDYSYKTYVNNNYKSHIGYVEHNLYKKQDNRTSNNTNNIVKHINQYPPDVINNCKINKTHIVKKTCDIHNNGVFLLINTTPLTLMIHTL